MKHTFKFTETVNREVTVELPCYRKYKSNSFYLIINEKEMIQVQTYDSMSGIQEMFSTSIAFGEETEEGTHEEFWRAYELVTRKLEQKALMIVDNLK